MLSTNQGGESPVVFELNSLPYLLVETRLSGYLLLPKSSCSSSVVGHQFADRLNGVIHFEKIHIEYHVI